MGVTIDEIAEAAHLIASLEPKPSRGFEQDEVRTVLPDVFVEKVGDEYVIYLNDDGVPRLRVSSLYRRMAGQEGGRRRASAAIFARKGARGNLADQEHSTAPADADEESPKAFSNFSKSFSIMA